MQISRNKRRPLFTGCTVHLSWAMLYPTQIKTLLFHFYFLGWYNNEWYEIYFTIKIWLFIFIKCFASILETCSMDINTIKRNELTKCKIILIEKENKPANYPSKYVYASLHSPIEFFAIQTRDHMIASIRKINVQSSSPWGGYFLKTYDCLRFYFNIEFLFKLL